MDNVCIKYLHFLWHLCICSKIIHFAYQLPWMICMFNIYKLYGDSAKHLREPGGMVLPKLTGLTPQMGTKTRWGVPPQMENKILRNYFNSLLPNDLRRKNAGGDIQITMGTIGKLVL